MTAEFRKNPLFQVFLGLIIGSLIISMVSFFVQNRKTRRLCLFRSYESNKLCTETRYFERMPAVQSVHAFVDDLLLGPFTNRYKAVMARGTRVEFCFEKDRVLYLGLSADALKPDAETSDIRGGVELIKENIVKNFTNFNKICIFIDGVAVLE